MATKSAHSLVKLYQKRELASLKFESTLEQLSGCLNQESLEPENLKSQDFSANDIIVVGKHFEKKKPVLGLRKESKKEEKREKVYRKGALAKFYILNQSTLDKDAEVWYYKQGKQIIGPVSSYNMDKMVYLKSINGETRVAFKNLEKFVKLQKILKIVEDNYKQQSESDEEES